MGRILTTSPHTSLRTLWQAGVPTILCSLPEKEKSHPEKRIRIICPVHSSHVGESCSNYSGWWMGPGVAPASVTCPTLSVTVITFPTRPTASVPWRTAKLWSFSSLITERREGKCSTERRPDIRTTNRGFICAVFNTFRITFLYKSVRSIRHSLTHRVAECYLQRGAVHLLARGSPGYSQSPRYAGHKWAKARDGSWSFYNVSICCGCQSGQGG